MNIPPQVLARTDEALGALRAVSGEATSTANRQAINTAYDAVRSRLVHSVEGSQRPTLERVLRDTAEQARSEGHLVASDDLYAALFDAQRAGRDIDAAKASRVTTPPTVASAEGFLESVRQNVVNASDTMAGARQAGSDASTTDSNRVGKIAAGVGDWVRAKLPR